MKKILMMMAMVGMLAFAGCAKEEAHAGAATSGGGCGSCEVKPSGCSSDGSCEVKPADCSTCGIAESCGCPKKDAAAGSCCGTVVVAEPTQGGCCGSAVEPVVEPMTSGHSSCSCPEHQDKK